MLLYLWATPEQRDLVQRTYARFQRAEELAPPAGLGLREGDLTAEEVEMLAAYRGAPAPARQSALTLLRSKSDILTACVPPLKAES